MEMRLAEETPLHKLTSSQNRKRRRRAGEKKEEGEDKGSPGEERVYPWEVHANGEEATEEPLAALAGGHALLVAATDESTTRGERRDRKKGAEPGEGESAALAEAEAREAASGCEESSKAWAALQVCLTIGRPLALLRMYSTVCGS